MSCRAEVVEFWNTEIGRWVGGDDRLHPDLERWRRAYAGSGDGAVDLSVFPEPYVGPLHREHSPALVMLGLNPGAAAPRFQGVDGIYTEQIRRTSYGEWAATARAGRGTHLAGRLDHTQPRRTPIPAYE